MEEILKIPVFGLNNLDKSKYILNHMNALNQFHQKNSLDFKNIMEKFGKEKQSYEHISDIPYIPVRLFKYNNLLSVPDKDIVKTMTSSGTSGQSVSKIFLDRDTAALQVKVLSKIMIDFIGSKRLPMLVIDTKSIISNREKFSARTTGVLGFSMFGRDVEYALNDDMTINFERVEKFLEKYKSNEVLIFGFTFILWKHFVLEIAKLGKTMNIPKGIIFHGGGWKQLEKKSVDSSEFNLKISNTLNISKVHNYYGMVEQTGSIFVECENGFLHSSSFSDVIIRNHKTHSPENHGTEGLIQLLSIIPKSYPGHSLLTEDIGTIYGVDNCECGRMGKYFKVHGRMKSAEIRGCSDTYS